MATPGIITGGNVFRLDEGRGTINIPIFKDVTTSTQPEQQLGVFGRNPGHTPKYALNRGLRDAEYRETMARIFVEVPPGSKDAFLASVSPETKRLASVLMSGTSTGGTGGTGFIDFILTQASEGFQEKTQIVDTLTDSYVAYYSGQEPPVFQYGGVLLNTYQDDQRVWMLRLYREILRGSRLANRKLIARLRYDSFIVSGYLENLSLSITGDTDLSASQFSFTMRVKKLTIETPSLGAPTFVSAATSDLTSDADAVTDPFERVLTVSPDDPYTAVSVPATEVSSVAIAQERAVVREELKATKSDEEIRAIQQTASETPGVQPAETDARDTLASNPNAQTDNTPKKRLKKTVRGTAPKVDENIEGVANDGAGGTTTVRAKETRSSAILTPPEPISVPVEQSGIPTSENINLSNTPVEPGLQSFISEDEVPFQTRSTGRNRGANSMSTSE